MKSTLILLIISFLFLSKLNGQVVNSPVLSYNINEIVYAIEPMPEKDKAVIVRGNAVDFVDIKTGKPYKSLNIDIWKSKSIDIEKNLFAIGTTDGIIKIYDIRSGNVIKDYKIPYHEIMSIGINPLDGQVITCTRAGKISLWDINKSKAVKSVDTEYSAVSEIYFHPKGIVFALKHLDQIIFFDAKTLKPVSTIKCAMDKYNFYYMCFSPDGEKLAATVDYLGTVLLYDITTGQLLKKIETNMGASKVDFNKEGTRLIISGGEYINKKTYTKFQVWDIETGTNLFWIRGNDTHYSAFFSNEDSYLLGNGKQGWQVWGTLPATMPAPGELIKTETDGNWMFLDNTFTDGYALAMYQNVDRFSFHFIDRNGNKLLNRDFTDAKPFSDGMAFVQMENQKCFIDTKGNILFTVPDSYYCEPFSEGLACVNEDNKYGYIDISGKLIISLNYDYAGSFSEGLAFVKKDNQYAYINKEGKVVINFQPFQECSNFKEGIARVYKNGKYSFIDKTGKPISAYQYDAANNFKEGFAVVGIKVESKRNADDPYDPGFYFKNGIIDNKGNVVVDYGKYETIGSFSDGYALVYENEEVFYINTKGEKVLGPFSEGRDFSEGYAYVKPQMEELGVYIDKNGEPSFGYRNYLASDLTVKKTNIIENGTPFSGGSAMVYLNKFWHVLNTSR